MATGSRITTFKAALIGAVLLAVPGLTASPASAQGFRMAQGAGGGAQTVSAEDLKVYGRVLSLDDAQQQAAEALHGAYVAERDKGEKDMRDQFRKLRDEFEDTRDMSIWQNKIPDITNTYAKQSKDLDKSFLSDIKSLLRADQAANWSTLERTHRRRQGMSGGMLAGESVDLVATVEALSLAKPPAELADTLDRYSAELDSALQERSRQREDLGKQMQAVGRGGGMPDFQVMEKLGTDMRKAGLKVRDINDRYAAMLRSAVPADKQAEFDTKVKKARYPSVYADSHTLKSLDAAAKFSDLDDTQKPGVQDVRESYLRDTEGANDRLTQAINQAEADGGGDAMFGGMARWMSGGGGGGRGEEGDTDLVKARKARREIDRAALDKLRALLNESQIDRLPERDDFGGPGGPGRRAAETGGRRSDAGGDGAGGAGRNSGRRPSGDR